MTKKKTNLLVFMCSLRDSMSIWVYDNFYNSVLDDEEAPPSYDSLFGKFKTCREETTSTFDFMHQSSSILLQTSKQYSAIFMEKENYLNCD